MQRKKMKWTDNSWHLLNISTFYHISTTKCMSLRFYVIYHHWVVKRNDKLLLICIYQFLQTGWCNQGLSRDLYLLYHFIKWGGRLGSSLLMNYSKDWHLGVNVSLATIRHKFRSDDRKNFLCPTITNVNRWRHTLSFSAMNTSRGFCTRWRIHMWKSSSCPQLCMRDDLWFCGFLFQSPWGLC